MTKMHYFSYKFSKIAKRWEHSIPAPHYLSILVIWSCVIWPNCGVSNWLWRNQTFEHLSDIITIMSPKSITKITSQNFPFWPLPIKISGYASG